MEAFFFSRNRQSFTWIKGEGCDGVILVLLKNAMKKVAWHSTGGSGRYWDQVLMGFLAITNTQTCLGVEMAATVMAKEAKGEAMAQWRERRGSTKR